MKESSADERQKLLDQFLNDLSSGAGAVFYDEDDLIEMYDYASDLGNNYARFEILMCGARLYPSSVPLAERKAFYLYQEGYLEAAKSALELLPEKSVLKKLLFLLLNPLPEELDRKTLNELLNSVKEFEDEEVIQLVQAASALGLYKWLIENYTTILAKCSYQQSFLFELLNEADRRGDFKQVIKLAEELTLLEPFNEEFWEKLAEVYITNHFELEKGLSYLDFALAIDPESVPALLLQARGLYELDRPIEEVMKILGKALELDPDNFATAQYMAICLYGKGYKTEAVDSLYDYLDSHPGNLDIVESILSMSDGRMKKDILAPLFNEGSEAVLDSLLTVAKEFISACEYGSALTILEYYDKKIGLKEDSALLLELFYRAGRYTELIEKWTVLPLSYRTHISDLVFLLSCIRTNKLELVDKHIKAITERWGNQSIDETYSEISSRLGALYIFTLISQNRAEGINIDIDECDPFNQPEDHKF
ncbi:MAG: hypothetical protein K2K52_02740 [Paramuribaculum sp.]|nr:hypothetical protein [Paramuribaculum sp.]